MESCTALGVKINHDIKDIPHECLHSGCTAVRVLIPNSLVQDDFLGSLRPVTHDYWSYSLFMSSYMDLRNILECEFHLRNFASAPVVGSQEQR